MSHTMTTQHHGGPNIRSQDVRYRRIGGDGPYRDDPNAPPVRFESYTRGGLGPEQDYDAFKKSYVSGRNPMGTCIRICCDKQTSIDDEQKYYQDDFNDLSWNCSSGTSDDDGIWLNRADPAGTIMAFMVWLLMGYSALTVVFLANTGGVAVKWSFWYTFLVCMALSCHIKTMLTDPGSVPASAVPTEEQRKLSKLSMCSQCQTFKPPLSHHCRICNRCVSKMDHHCPWMNNCVGAGNMKHFFLFLCYTWTCSVFSLVLLGSNYFFCATEDCTFNLVLIQLVRIMTLLSIGAFLFTSSMIMNVVYGLMTGIGTIDRLKKKATNTMGESDEAPVPATEVFGIGPLYTWILPVDPIFEDYDKSMGYSTPQRLLREQILREQSTGYAGSVVSSFAGPPSMVMGV